MLEVLGWGYIHVEALGYFISASCSKYTLMGSSNPIAGIVLAPVMNASTCPRLMSSSVKIRVHASFLMDADAD